MENNKGAELSAEDMLKRMPAPQSRTGQTTRHQEALLMEMVINEKATLAAQLELTGMAIVGLDFVTEFIDPDDNSQRIYKCTLCSTFRTVGTIMEHLCGFNHRVNYIAKQSPEEAKGYMLPDDRKRNRNIKLAKKVARERCKGFELVHGRGNVTSKTKKVNIPEEDLDTDEETPKEHEINTAENMKDNDYNEDNGDMKTFDEKEDLIVVRAVYDLMNDFSDESIEEDKIWEKVCEEMNESIEKKIKIKKRFYGLLKILENISQLKQLNNNQKIMKFVFAKIDANVFHKRLMNMASTLVGQ